MKNYHIKLYNSTSSFNGRMVSNVIFESLNEKIQIIDLCKMQEILYKPWIGAIDSLNCTKNYLDYYLTREMSLLITTSDVPYINRCPTGIVKKELYKFLSNDYSFNANIDTIDISISFREFAVFLAVLFCLVQIIQKLWKIIQLKKCSFIQNIKFDENMEDQNCSICLEEFNTNDKISVLQCRHIYHRNCIFDWVKSQHDKKNTRCPNCNSNIFNPENNDLLETLIN